MQILVTLSMEMEARYYDNFRKCACSAVPALHFCADPDWDFSRNVTFNITFRVGDIAKDKCNDKGYIQHLVLNMLNIIWDAFAEKSGLKEGSLNHVQKNLFTNWVTYTILGPETDLDFNDFIVKTNEAIDAEAKAKADIK